MSLRNKALIIILAVVVALIGGQYLTARFILGKSYLNLERKMTVRNLDRARDAYANEVAALDRICTDYANWDDTYQFLSDSNQGYIEANLTVTTFKNLELNYLFFVKPSYAVHYAVYYNDSNQIIQPLSADVSNNIIGLLHSGIDSCILKRNGALVLDSGPILLAANPILTSDAEGPPRGTLIMGYNLDQKRITHLEEITHLGINIYSTSKTNLPSSVGSAIKALQGGVSQVIQSLDQDTVAGYAFIKDILGQSQLVLNINRPREIYHQGIISARYFIITTMIIALIFGIAIYLLLDKLILEGMVLARLRSVSTQVNNIASSSNFSARVPINGDDELSRLASDINGMLAALQQSDEVLQKYSRQLEELVEKRTRDLRISENKLRTIFTASPDAIVICDLEGKILDCNRVGLDLYKFKSVDEVVGRSVFEFVSAEERTRASGELQRTQAEKLLSNIEFTLLDGDGIPFQAELSASYIQDLESEFDYYVIVSRDVTERKKAQAELAWNEALLRSMADSSPLAFYVVDTRTNKVLFFNRRFCEIWGIEHLEHELHNQEISNQNVISCMMSEMADIPNFMQKCQQLSQEDDRTVLDHEIPFRNGRIIRHLSSQIRDSGDGYWGRLCIFEEVTERREVERALSQSEHRYRLLFERSVAGVFCTSVDGRFIDCNDAYARILGFSCREEIIGARVKDYFYDPGDREIFLDQLRSQGSVKGYEFHLRRRDGSSVWILENATLVLGEAGEPMTIHGTVLDITERKMIQERERELQLELMQQAKLAGIGMLAAGMAHNVNVPLQGIITHIELLKLTRKDLPYLDDILEQAMRISLIVNNMLLKSRHEQSQQEEDIDLNKLLADELEFLDADLTFKHEINKTYDFDPFLPSVRGIYSDFSQTLVNLIRNAVDAMYESEKKWLTVRTACSGEDHILIEIMDTGCGMTPELKDRIFDPFFTTKPIAGQQVGNEPIGTGLGLSTVHYLMRKYETRIEIQSELGEGTIFRLFIPCRPMKVPPDAAAETLSEEIMESNVV